MATMTIYDPTDGGRGTTPVDAHGNCPHHPFVRLQRLSHRTKQWISLLDTCPLCQVEDEDSTIGGGTLASIGSNSKSSTINSKGTGATYPTTNTESTITPLPPQPSTSTITPTTLLPSPSELLSRSHQQLLEEKTSPQQWHAQQHHHQQHQPSSILPPPQPFDPFSKKTSNKWLKHHCRHETMNAASSNKEKKPIKSNISKIEAPSPHSSSHTLASASASANNTMMISSKLAMKSPFSRKNSATSLSSFSRKSSTDGSISFASGTATSKSASFISMSSSLATSRKSVTFAPLESFDSDRNPYAISQHHPHHGSASSDSSDGGSISNGDNNNAATAARRGRSTSPSSGSTRSLIDNSHLVKYSVSINSRGSASSFNGGSANSNEPRSVNGGGSSTRDGSAGGSKSGNSRGDVVSRSSSSRSLSKCSFPFSDLTATKRRGGRSTSSPGASFDNARSSREDDNSTEADQEQAMSGDESYSDLPTSLADLAPSCSDFGASASSDMAYCGNSNGNGGHYPVVSSTSYSRRASEGSTANRRTLPLANNSGTSRSRSLPPVPSSQNTQQLTHHRCNSLKAPPVPPPLPPTHHLPRPPPPPKLSLGQYGGALTPIKESPYANKSKFELESLSASTPSLPLNDNSNNNSGEICGIRPRSKQVQLSRSLRSLASPPASIEEDNGNSSEYSIDVDAHLANLSQQLKQCSSPVTRDNNKPVSSRSLPPMKLHETKSDFQRMPFAGSGDDDNATARRKSHRSQSKERSHHRSRSNKERSRDDDEGIRVHHSIKLHRSASQSHGRQQQREKKERRSKSCSQVRQDIKEDDLYSSFTSHTSHGSKSDKNNHRLSPCQNAIAVQNSSNDVNNEIKKATSSDELIEDFPKHAKRRSRNNNSSSKNNINSSFLSHNNINTNTHTFDSRGRCLYHPSNKLRKKTLFRGWKVVMKACPDCCVDELRRMRKMEDDKIKRIEEENGCDVGRMAMGQQESSQKCYNGISSKQKNRKKTGLQMFIPRTRRMNSNDTASITQSSCGSSRGSYSYLMSPPAAGAGAYNKCDIPPSRSPSIPRSEAASSNDGSTPYSEGESSNDGSNVNRGRHISSVGDNLRAVVERGRNFYHIDDNYNSNRPDSMPPPISRLTSTSPSKLSDITTPSKKKLKNKANKKKKPRAANMHVRQMEYTDIQGHRGHYSGTVNADFFPHGDGIMVYDDGREVEGNWIDGCFFGSELKAPPGGGSGRQSGSSNDSKSLTSRRSKIKG